MTLPTSSRTGADILADTLHGFGVRHVFHIPGEGILEMVDALAARHADIRLTSFRHEGGMAYAAQALGQVTGQPGVCLAARAPGALNTLLALHTAETDAAPLLLIVGQAAAGQAGRDPLGGPDLGEVFRPVVKSVLQVGEAARVPEVLARAWQAAMSGRQGPVVVVVPENVMHENACVADLQPPRPVRPAPPADDMARLQGLCAGARKPLLLLGGSGWDAAALDRMAAFAARCGWPVATAYRRGDLVDHADPHFAGETGIGIDPVLAEGIAQADLVLAVNVRLGEINTFGAGGFGGFRLLDAPRPRQALVHVHAEAGELNRVYQADLAIQADPCEFAAALQALPVQARPDEGWLAGMRAARERFVGSGACDASVDLRKVFEQLRERLPAQAVVTVGAGAYAVWLHRYFALRRGGRMLGPKSGAMGYGLPAAIGAALADAARPVVAVAGDGCFLMHAEELATAVQHGLRIVIVVVNNGGYGAIRGSQLRLFGRAVGTDLHNPSFADYARAFGAHAERIEETGAFLPALERALDAAGPSLLELVLPATVGKPQ